MSGARSPRLTASHHHTKVITIDGRFRVLKVVDGLFHKKESLRFRERPRSQSVEIDPTHQSTRRPAPIRGRRGEQAGIKGSIIRAWLQRLIDQCCHFPAKKIVDLENDK